jgi:hypothetical protein
MSNQQELNWALCAPRLFLLVGICLLDFRYNYVGALLIAVFAAMLFYSLAQTEKIKP